MLKMSGSVKSGLSPNLQIVSISLELLLAVNGVFTPVTQSSNWLKEETPPSCLVLFCCASILPGKV